MSVAKTLQRIKQFIPPLSGEMHKGQAGRVGVIGGSEEYRDFIAGELIASYTGAPYYSCMSCMLFGADMGHVICEPGAASVIKS
jgi:ATP-dependent NAD(P)H-hydrate dehydratase